MTLEPGTTLGRYEILAPLGHGGMATVYRAYHPSLDRVVALKVLRADLAREPEFLARFDREAKAIARLRHPHIVEVFDYDVDRGHPFIVMEFVEAGTLKTKLEELHGRGERLPARESGRIVAEVAGALSFAHEQGIVHRDVKPSNVLLTRAGKAVVTDFGIARVLAATSHTQTGVGIGTPEYMSPEQGQGRRVDHRSDIYSLGIVAYELLSGSVPFTADTPLAVVYAHAHDPLPLPSQRNPAIGPRTEQALLKALAKDASARFETAVGFAEALRSAIEEAATPTLPRVTVAASPAPPAPAAAAPPRPIAANPLQLFLAATGALLEALASQAAFAAGALVAVSSFVSFPLALYAAASAEGLEPRVPEGDPRFVLDLLAPALSSLALVPVALALRARVGAGRVLTAATALAVAALLAQSAWRIAAVLPFGLAAPVEVRLTWQLLLSPYLDEPPDAIALLARLTWELVPRPRPYEENGLRTLHAVAAAASLALALWLLAANGAAIARKRLPRWLGALGVSAGALFALSVLLDALALQGLALYVAYVPRVVALSLWAIWLGRELSAVRASVLLPLSVAVVVSAGVDSASVVTAVDELVIAAAIAAAGVFVLVGYLYVLVAWRLGTRSIGERRG